MAARRSTAIGWAAVAVVVVVVAALLVVHFATKSSGPTSALSTTTTTTAPHLGLTTTPTSDTGTSTGTTGSNGAGNTGTGATGATGRTGATGSTGTTGETGASSSFASVLQAVTHVPAADLNAAGIAGESASSSAAEDPYGPVQSSGADLPETDGKPTFFFFGAEFCPFCAIERWSLIIALSRFGTFSGLVPIASSPTDYAPNTQTFSFLHATYSSPYVGFESVELEDVNHNPLQTPDASETSVLDAWDSIGDFPFYDLAGRYVGGLPNWLDPMLVQGQSRSQIAADLLQPTQSPGNLILANANYVTAAICAVDGGKPGDVCTSVGVEAAADQMSQLPAAQPLSG